MQPFRALRPMGYSFLRTSSRPGRGLGIDFDIVESKGPSHRSAIRSRAQVEALRRFEPAEGTSRSWVRGRRLRQRRGIRRPLLGFVGAP